MKKILIVFFNFFLLLSNMNYQIINATEEESSADNTSLITEENDTNTSNVENNIQENDSTNEDNILTINSSLESSTDNTSLTTEETDINTSNEENPTQENDSTNESDELTINDLSEDESISTIASSSIQFLVKDEIKTLLSSINVTDLYFGTKNDYPQVDFTKYTKYNLKNSYELYYFLDSSTRFSEAYVISDDDKQIVFPESCLSMFAKLTTLKQIHFDNINTEHVTNMQGMFADCNNLTYVDISNFNTLNVKDMSFMFANCSSLSSIDLSNLNTENVTLMNHMFSGCTNLISLDLSNITTHKVTNMSYMFATCSKLPSIDVSSFNTENVTNMSCMFARSKNITSLDLSNFNTKNVTNLSWMFTDCSNLTYVDISKFNTENVKNLDHMFYNCINLTAVDVSNFNTDKVTNMLGMFSTCQKLAYVDVSKFNTENVTNMSWMFASCNSLPSLDVSNFNTEKVTNMEGMFSNLTITTLDLSNFKTANVTNMGRMFFNCKNLNTIYATTDFIAPSNSERMFSGCTSLKGGKGTKFSSNKVHNEYACIDGGTDSPGYFSIKHPDKPTLSNDTYTYNESKQTVVIDGFENTTMDIEGDNQATNVGSYTFTVKSKTGKWSDGTKEPVTFTWFIVKANPSYTLPTGLKATQGDMLSDVTLPDGWTWNTPETQLTNAGSNTYKATFTPIDTDNYNVLNDIDVTVIVEAAPVKPTLSVDNIYTYTGSEQTAAVTGFDSSSMKIDGHVKTNAGTYIITVTPIKQWSDGSTDSLTIQWVIEKATATVPVGLKAAQGEKLSDIPLPEGWAWDEPHTLLSAGDSQLFKASYTPADPLNYNESKNVDLTVDVEFAPDKPTLSKYTYTYNESKQTVVIDGFENTTMDIEGDNQATNVGSYTFTVKSKTGKWSDGTKEPVTFTWFIVKANPSYTLPTGLKATQGDMLSDVTLPDGWTWNTPETQLTNAGSNTYKATFTPIDTDNYNVLNDIDVTVIVEAALVKPENNTSTISTNNSNRWDDGGPFTTDKCGNVFDRWNNKIYEANGCNVGGYNLVRTSVID